MSSKPPYVIIGMMPAAVQTNVTGRQGSAAGFAEGGHALEASVCHDRHDAWHNPNKRNSAAG
jgi:hypothetical protein